MKNFFVLFLIGALGFLSNTSGTFAKPRKVNDLAAILPASDGIISVDIERLTTIALPQILSAKPEMLAKINTQLDRIKEKSGIDLRQFQRAVIGVSLKQNSAGVQEMEPLLLVRGKTNAEDVLNIARTASKGKYRAEKVGEKVVYVFAMDDIAKQNKPPIKDSNLDSMTDAMVSNLTRELAVGIYDERTLAIGSLARVSESLSKRTIVAPEILSLAQRKPNAVLSFAMQLPDGASSFMKLDNDDVGEMLGAVRSISGSLDVDGANANVSLAAKSANVEGAKKMEGMLSGLQVIGKSFLRGMKGNDKAIISRMIDNAKFARVENEVTLDLQVPQTDINSLMSKK